MRTIAHISDLHFGMIDERIVQGLAADLEARQPSLVVVSGDLTQRARAWQYQQAAEFLKQLPRPQLVVPGNHDIPLYDVIRRFFFPLQKYSTYITSDLGPVYRDEEMVVVGINTARSFAYSLYGFWKDGRISPPQLEYLRMAMRDVPESVLRVVVTHHPFLPRSADLKHDVVGGATGALVTMEQCGVDLLLAGHLHTGYHGDVRTFHAAVTRGILSVQAGTATSTRHRTGPNSYNWITADPREMSIEIRGWNGSQFVTTAMAACPRCQSGSKA